jgi:pyridoxal phosphate enzyme (YggS family)
MFQERLEALRRRIELACARAGRNPAGVRLIAVSKTHGPDRIREATDCGVRVFGENKVQEAKAKIPLCAGNLSWHMVGHLQRNKAYDAVRLFEMIHSIDSLKLLETIDAACDKAGRNMPALIEVNVSGESSKFGIAPEGVPEILDSANRFMHVNIMGLMTMPPFTEEPEKARSHFRRLRALRDQWRTETDIGLEELSMGMTHDFEIAIEEGATWIRVGTALFGERGETWRPAISE